MSHTKGPWRLFEVHPEGEPGLWQIDQGNLGNKVLAHVYDKEADANLIAAAPDLLAALEAVLEWDEPGPFGLVQELLDQCQAAIKKARGE